MPSFHNPKVLLLPLFALLIWSAFGLHPSSASAVVLRNEGFKVVLTPLASEPPQIETPNWVLPVRPALGVVHEFLRPTSDWGAGHRGIDFQVSSDQQILAPHEGVVSFSGLAFDVPTVVLSHEGSASSTFQPVCLSAGMTVGAKVLAGQPFGVLCQSDSVPAHCGALPCVHWGFRLDKGVSINPLRLVGLLKPSQLRSIDRVVAVGDRA